MAFKRVLFHSTFLTAIAVSAATALAGPLSPLTVDDGNTHDVNGTEAYSSIVIGEDNPDQVLNVLDGGDLSSEILYMGLNAGSTGNAATVSDGGTWTNAGSLVIGNKGGENTFTVESGGSVGTQSTFLGLEAGGGENTLDVSGSLTNSDRVVVGTGAGENTVTIHSGGSVTSAIGIVGAGADGGSNAITVTGTGSHWTNSGNFVFGDAGGDNTLNVVDGGKVAVGADMVVGAQTSSDQNELTVSGSGSELKVTKTLYVGQSSDGNSLTIQDGASLITKNARIGGGDNDSVATSQNNSVLVTGTGSSWVSNGTLRIGDGTDFASSGNSLTVADGATVTFSDPLKAVFIGFSEIDENNSLIVTGAGSSLTAGAILVGASSLADGTYTDAKNSLLEVTDGGSVSTLMLVVGGHSTMKVGAGASVTANGFGVMDGGTLSVALSDTNPATITADTVSLNGTLNADVGSGGLRSNRYDVINYTDREGEFDALTLSGAGAANFAATIGYDPTVAYVQFTADLGGGETLNKNQNNVANALDDYFNDGGTFTTAIAGLYGLTGSDLKQALTEATGEVGATGGVNAIERATTSFLNLMLGGGGQSAAPGSLHHVAEAATPQTGVVPTADVPPAEAGWSLWGGVYGGAANLPGSSSNGSHDTNTNVGGIAAGLDYDLAPDSRIGLAIAGGQTNWDLSDNLGNGDSTFFQLGGYGTQRFGASYLSLGAAYAWHNMSTDRHVNIDGSEKLDADFDASNLSGRIEAGHRFAAGSQLGLTPYAAFQAQSVWMPGYREHGAAADESFAVSYNSNTATALRSELGVGIDTSLGLDPASASLFGRVAWAHDWNSDANVQASFVSLDMSTFTVYGADTPDNIALVTAGADVGLTEATRLAATFDGEFGSGYQSYAGSLKLSYSW